MPRTTPGQGIPRASGQPGGPRAAGGAGAAGARRPSGEVRMSAARTAQKPAAQTWQKRLWDLVTDVALNVWGITKETYEGFQRSNLYFKYRVFIVAGWVFLSASGMGVACSGGWGDSNALGARLVVSWVNDQPVYMVVNDSNDAWEDVRLVVNDQYSAAAVRIPPGAELTIGAKKLIDETGRPAPATLQVRKLVLKSANEKVDLVKDGQMPLPPRP